MKNSFLIYFKKNKKVGLFGFLILFFLAYYAYGYLWGTKTDTRYILTTVERGTLITSVSSTGQVSSYDQIVIKPRASGDIIWMDLFPGKIVRSGQAIASIDSVDAKKTLADAEISLAEAYLNFEKAQAQAPIDHERKIESLENSENDLVKKYEDSFNSISNAFLDLPSVITGLQNILYGYEMDQQSRGWNMDAYKNLFDGEDRELIVSLVEIAVKDYNLARIAYDKSFLDFKILTRYSERQKIEEVLEQALETTKLMAQSAKSSNNILDTIIDINDRKGIKTSATITTFKNNIKNYLSNTNSHLSSLLSQKSSITDIKQTIVNTQRDIDILKIGNPTGDNPITLQVSLNSIKKKEVEVADLRSKLANYTIRAPFDGVVAVVNVKKGDTVSSGTSIATIVTKQKIAEVSFNEVDVAKIKLGQKATLLFDAIEDLSISGKVSEIDAIGSVSQGVVTYNVKVSFDTQDDRVKPGMSVSASIITEAKADVLLVSSGAVKLQNNEEYVEIFEKKVVFETYMGTQGLISEAFPVKKNIQVGISNDIQTEVLGGLSEGDVVVVRTTTSSSKNVTTGNSTSGIRIPGIGGVGSANGIRRN